MVKYNHNNHIHIKTYKPVIIMPQTPIITLDYSAYVWYNKAIAN